MKFFTFSVLFIVCSGLIAAQSLRVSPNVVHMGDIVLKSENKVTLTCVNVSDKPLVIRKIETDCSCTKPSWSKSPLMPGDSIQVTVTMIPTDRGAFYKSVRFITAPKMDTISQIILRGRAVSLENPR